MSDIFLNPENNEVKISELINRFDLEVVNLSDEKKESTTIRTSELNRPGLQLSGYFDYFYNGRIQIIGKSEYYYFYDMPIDKKRRIIEKYFSKDFPILIFSHGVPVEEPFLELASKYDVPILKTDKGTTSIMNKLSYYLETRLANSERIHGVLVEVFGVGVLIKGDSGVGKSETALELVQRGHRLVADDSVIVRSIDETRLVGTSPELIRHFMEIRGVGIIDIKAMYGAGAVRYDKDIDMIVYLEEWDQNKYYDRIGVDREREDLLGVELPKTTIPVKPGRNIAMIVEVAAMNYRQIVAGYDSALEFTKNLERITMENK